MSQTLFVSPREFLQAVINLTKANTEHLANETAKINFEKDAEEIKKKFMQATHSNKMKSVSAMIEERRTKYFDLFMKTERISNETYNTKRQFDEVIAKHRKDERTMADVAADKKSAQLKIAKLREFKEYEMEVEALRAAEFAVADRISQLKSVRDQRRAASTALDQKRKRIQSFELMSVS